MNPEPSGILVLDKPGGITSHDAVNRIRRLFHTRRVGHAGTLDPEATGVLVICIGQATRLAEYAAASSKRYAAGFTLGVETATQDAWGEVTARTDASHLAEQAVREAVCRFRGPQLQVPPMVSALHHNGQRLYELARRGQEVVRLARPITLYEYHLHAFCPGEQALLEVEVLCSTGVYVRTLAADLGAALGVGGMMHSLRRLQAGAFGLEDAVTLPQLEELQRDGRELSVLLPAAAVLRGMPQYTLQFEQAQQTRHGSPLLPEQMGLNAEDISSDLPLLLMDEEGQLIALARLEEGRIQPYKVMQQP